jgi:cellulose synthase (UDP-forming)
MTTGTALGLVLAVAGFLLLVVPLLPRRRTWARTLVVVLTLALWGRYLVWRATATAPPRLASGEGTYFVLALAAEGLALFSMAIFYLTLTRTTDRSAEADRLEAWLRSLPPERLPTVDVFLPTYNEGREVVERGIVAAKALDYPRFRVWVLDDGRRDWLRDLCAAKGVGYVRRPDNKHAKAGNINHALSVTGGEYFAVFDADFTPYRNFLYRTVGFLMADPRVSVVQTPQHFFNVDVFQHNLGLTGAMQDNERAWYDVILPSRDAWDCAFCCGSSALLRREAFLSIGGIPTDSVTEDVLATMTLFRRGYVTRYLNERLSMGLMPEDLRGLAIQRGRWARGAMQILFLKMGGLGPGLTWLQRLLFLQYHYLIDFPCRLVLLLLPLVYLWTGLPPFRIDSLAELAAYQLPPLLATMGLSWWFFPKARAPLVSAATILYISGRVFPSVVATLIKPFGAPFRVTPKGQDGGVVGDPWAVGVVAALIALSVGGIAFSRLCPDVVSDPASRIVATGWAMSNLLLLAVMLLCLLQKPRLRAQERFPVNEPGRLHLGGELLPCRVVDLSLEGALVEVPASPHLGDTCDLTLEEVGLLPATVARVDRGRLGLQFGALPEASRDRLITMLYATGRTNAVGVVDRFEVLQRVIWRLLLGSS